METSRALVNHLFRRPKSALLRLSGIPKSSRIDLVFQLEYLISAVIKGCLRYVGRPGTSKSGSFRYMENGE